MLNRRLGRYEDALALARQALATFEALGHAVAVGRVQHAIGVICHSWNRYDDAFAAYEAALAHYEAAGLQHEQISVRTNLALILEERGAYHAALTRHERALQDSPRVGADEHGSRSAWKTSPCSMAAWGVTPRRPTGIGRRGGPLGESIPTSTRKSARRGRPG